MKHHQSAQPYTSISLQDLDYIMIIIWRSDDLVLRIDDLARSLSFQGCLWSLHPFIAEGAIEHCRSSRSCCLECILQRRRHEPSPSATHVHKPHAGACGGKSRQSRREKKQLNHLHRVGLPWRLGSLWPIHPPLSNQIMPHLISNLFNHSFPNYNLIH